MQETEFTKSIDPYRRNRFKRRLLAPFFSIYTAPEKWLYARQILSTKTLSLPNFLGIGGPQCGTTWLSDNLRIHPEIFIPKRKELRYFSLGFHKSLRFSYAAKFKPGGEKMKGEITPEYAVLPLNRIRYIRRLLPDVRLIFIMRNPIDRVWSAARRALSRLPGRTFTTLTQLEFQTYFQVEHCRKLTDYPSILNNWLSVFPDEQFHVAVFDDISQRPREMLTDIFRHIGVSENVDWSAFAYGKIVNKNPEAAMPQRIRNYLEDMYRPQIEALHERFGLRVAHWRC